MSRWSNLAACAVVVGGIVLATGCATVDVTKTVNAEFSETDPDEVAILSEFPKERSYVEIATVASSGWEMDDADEMHQKLREEASQIGANAVVLLHSGIDEAGDLWCTGAAIHFSAQP